MGESRRANMMGQRVFIIALMASSLCVALPTTDLVVPEAKNAGTSGAQFVQSTLKSGGTEAQCRTFATETISGVNAGVTAEQGELDLFDTGAGCAQEGQSGVATATTNKANADDDVVIKTQAVTDATATQATACNAPVTMVVNLPTLTANTCYGYTQEAHYLSVQAACDAANTALSQANTALSDAQTAATDAQTALDAAVAEAARRMSVCHCNVQQEQAAAWTAAGTATASHVTEWKKAHEVLCALGQTTTCTVPTCPAVTQPTLAAGVADEDCSTEPAFCTGNEQFCEDFESYTSTSSMLSTVWAEADTFTASNFDFHEGPECFNGGKCLRFNACNGYGDAFTQQTFSGSRTLTFMAHGAVLYGPASGFPGRHAWPHHPTSSTASQGWTEHTVGSPGWTNTVYGNSYTDSHGLERMARTDGWRLMFETNAGNDCVSYLDNVKVV